MIQQQIIDDLNKQIKKLNRQKMINTGITIFLFFALLFDSISWYFHRPSNPGFLGFMMGAITVAIPLNILIISDLIDRITTNKLLINLHKQYMSFEQQG